MLFQFAQRSVVTVARQELMLMSNSSPRFRCWRGRHLIVDDDELIVYADMNFYPRQNEWQPGMTVRDAKAQYVASATVTDY